MRYAHACGLIGRDPTAGVSAAPKRRADDAPERVTAEMVPTRTEALAILAGTPAGYPAAAALGLAGLRIGECVGMRAEAVDRATRQVTVDQQAQPLTGHGMVLTTPKAERVRTITVPGLVAVELRRHLREHPTGILFAGTSDGLLRPTSLYELAWLPALAAAGLEGRFVFHALRHFCASGTSTTRRAELRTH